MACQQTAKREPVLLWHLSLRDEQETRQARFGCQQVIK